MAELCFNTFNRSAWFGVDPDLPAQLAAAAQAGFRWWGPDVFSLDAWIASGRAVLELVELQNTHNLACWELTALNITDEAETLDQAHHLAELAAVLRPKWVLTNVGAPIDDGLCHTFSLACDVLAEAGARPALEYLPFTPANSIATARVLIDHVGPDRAGILFDTWHHFRGPDTDAELEAAPLDLVAYVQFDDALPAVSDDLMAETVGRRAFPGEGEFDLEGYCSRMRAKGFDGVVSVEILNDDWRQRDVGEFARRAYTSSARYWS
ncbi:MAG TPA: sugar phosphate isomerase/epimerase family protein [Acidimicrobiales bacterium]|jgi:sugar phosphate isomerase/epimerase